MFAPCQYSVLIACEECGGTGRRGAKANGKKRCRKCGETLHPGQVDFCTVKKDEGIEPCMYCPRNAANQSPTTPSES